MMGRINRFWRDCKLIFRIIGLNLTLYVLMIILSAVILKISDSFPDSGWLNLIVNVYHMTVVERVLDSGQGIFPPLLSLLLPLLTFLILSEGVLRVISIYINRKNHRKEWDELMVKTFSDHVIVCGVGELGKALVRRLLLSQPNSAIVLVELKADILAELGLSNERCIHIQADMTSMESLQKASCDKAKMIIVTSGNDSFNLETALKACTLNQHALIWVRLHRGELANLIEANAKPNIHFFCPYQQAADVLLKEFKNLK